MNIFGDIFDGEKLREQKPYERPLLPGLVRSTASSYTLQEKLLSFSGEDFRVKDIEGNEVMIIDGGNINLGGWVLDKLAFKDAEGKKFCSVERRAIAASTCECLRSDCRHCNRHLDGCLCLHQSVPNASTGYDIYSPDGKELLAKVEREWMSVTPKYK